MSALRTLETGQFCLAELASSSNFCRSMPGTCARRVSADLEIRKPWPSFSSETAVDAEEWRIARSKHGTQLLMDVPAEYSEMQNEHRYGRIDTLAALGADESSATSYRSFSCSDGECR